MAIGSKIAAILIGLPLAVGVTLEAGIAFTGVALAGVALAGVFFAGVAFAGVALEGVFLAGVAFAGVAWNMKIVKWYLVIQVVPQKYKP